VSWKYYIHLLPHVHPPLLHFGNLFTRYIFPSLSLWVSSLSLLE
jgi:hypothetical protein